MLNVLVSIFAILVTIIFVIGTHEYAHFIAARMVGIKVLKFSIGFGKTLFHFFDKRGTEYIFALIPLGGYVKMLDEREGHVPANEMKYTYNQQSYWKKCFVVLAGPAMNLLCALLLYWVVFMIGVTTIKPIVGVVKPDSIAASAGLKPKQEIVTIDDQEAQTWTAVIFRLISHAGDNDSVNVQTKDIQNAKESNVSLNLSNWQFDPLKPDLLGSIGITPYMPDIPLVIGNIGANTPAATSQLKLGDRIISINDKPIKDWEALVKTIANQPGETAQFKIERNKKILTLPIEIGAKRTFIMTKYGYLGIGPQFEWPKNLLKTIQYSPIPALAHAAQQVWDLSYFNLVLFGKMITGKLSLQSLGGPITIFESAGTALNGGTIVFLSFLAFLSLSIGVINLFPIPGLDGGHILIHTIELIIRKPLSETFLNIIFRVGLLFILFILVQALINDILRLY